MVAVIMLALAVVVMYIRVTRKYVDLRTAGAGDKDDTIIGNAKKIADQILDDAKKKSKLMLSESEDMRGKYAENIDKLVASANEHYMKLFEAALKDSQDKLIEGVNNISGSVASVVNQDIVNVRETLAAQLNKMQTDIKNEVDKTYESLELNLESYKKMRMAQIDSAIFDIVEVVTRKVLSKEITPEEHEKLVIKALTEAKKQNVFFGDNTESESSINSKNSN